jgi:hypothetical protein
MKAKTGEGCEFVKKGSVLLTAKPFAFILKSKFQGQRCDFCFQRLNNKIYSFMLEFLTPIDFTALKSNGAQDVRLYFTVVENAREKVRLGLVLICDPFF